MQLSVVVLLRPLCPFLWRILPTHTIFKVNIFWRFGFSFKMYEIIKRCGRRLHISRQTNQIINPEVKILKSLQSYKQGSILKEFCFYHLFGSSFDYFLPSSLAFRFQDLEIVRYAKQKCFLAYLRSFTMKVLIKIPLTVKFINNVFLCVLKVQFYNVHDCS